MTIGASHICSVLHSHCRATRPKWFRTWLGATVSATRVSPPSPRAGSTDCFTPPERWFMLARWFSPLWRHVTVATAVEDSGWYVCEPVTAKRNHNIIRAVAYVRGTYRPIQYSFIHLFIAENKVLITHEAWRTYVVRRIKCVPPAGLKGMIVYLCSLI